VRPSGAEVVAAPPRLTPLEDRSGTMSFIQYETESDAEMSDWPDWLGSYHRVSPVPPLQHQWSLALTLKNKAFLTVEGQLACCPHQSDTWFGPQSMGTNSRPSESPEP
jgi:hypothetical protein